MTFKEKIDKILEVNTLGIDSVTALEDAVAAGRSAINNFYNENKDPGRKTLKRIKSLPGLNLEWWETGIDPVFLPEPAEKPTYGEKDPAIPQNPLRAPEEVYRNLVEANSAYRLVPKVILEGKYVMILESEIGKTEAALWETIRSKDDLIRDLKEEIATYRALRTPAEKRE